LGKKVQEKVDQVFLSRRSKVLPKLAKHNYSTGKVSSDVITDHNICRKRARSLLKVVGNEKGGGS
jgi:hypothetical protein